MQELNGSSSLSDRAYAITKRYHRINGALIWTIAFALALCFSLLTAGVFKLSDRIEALGLSDRDLLSSVVGIYFMLGAIMFILAFTLGLVTLRGRKTYRELKEWGQDYLYGAYILNFATSTPKGDTTGERVWSIAKFVFPELKKLKKMKDGKTEKDVIKECINKKFGPISVDLALETSSGHFIVKEFKDTVVTIDHLKDFVRSLKHGFRKGRIFRIVILSQDYDQIFFESDKLEIEIRRLGKNLPLDLLIQDPKGYSVLRVASAV